MPILRFWAFPTAHPYSFEDVTNNDQTSAPTAVRQASERFVRSLERYDFDVGGPLYDGRPIRPSTAATWPATSGTSRTISIAPSRPCARSSARAHCRSSIGGDHAIPIPVLRAFEGRGPITLVQIDAHLDWRDDVNGVREGLSSPIRRASEMSHIDKIFQIGIRAQGSARPRRSRPRWPTAPTSSRPMSCTTSAWTRCSSAFPTAASIT